jgi:hypothetical protein
MAKYVLPTMIDAQADAREDICCNRGCEEKRLERKGLVIGPREEEIGFRGGDGACEERDERGVGVVEDEVELWRESGVFLDGM